MWGKVVFVVVLGLVAQHVFKLMMQMGAFKHVYNHHPGPCQLVPGIDGGSEDMEMTADGKLFISSGLGNMLDYEDPIYKDVKGQIFLLDTRAQNPDVLSLPIHGNLDLDTFRPHGISLWTDPNTGDLYIYVINHPGVDTVEKFVFDEERKVLRHVTSLSDPAMRVMNDIKVVGRDRFYFTNFFYFNTVLGFAVETVTPVKLGSVGFYDGSKGTTMLNQLANPNGINASPDGRYLYVAVTGAELVQVFTINQDYSLVPHDRIVLYSGVDNIDVCPMTGDIYVGSHPQMMKTMQASGNPKLSKAPSQVIRVKMRDGHAVHIEELYSDDGSLVSASSVGLYRNQKLYIGTVFDRMAVCEVYYMS